MSSAAEVRILMICMGNICRSPTAEGVLRHKLRQAGLEGRVEVDSAGTHGYHVGAPPDERAQHHALKRGYDLSSLRARKVRATDFDRFDLLLVMDDQNHEHLSQVCPEGRADRVRRLMEFAPQARSGHVPDPYCGGEDHFERVLDLVEEACDGLIEHLRQRLTP
ncbi:MAG: low molecular weight protein-tyrosine-phosphatase [Pseudomonadota bacterium]